MTDVITPTPEPTVPGNPHGEYRIGTTAWRHEDGDIQVRGPLVVQCRCQGPHVDKLVLEAKLVHAGGLTAWVVTVDAADPFKGRHAATEGAHKLAELLGKEIS